MPNGEDSDFSLIVVAANLLSRAGLSALLEDAGCLVLAQSDGADLAHALRRWTPDALAVDLGWRGEALCRILADLDSDIPTLALLPEEEDDDLLRMALTALESCAAYGILRREAEPTAMVRALSALEYGMIVLEPVLCAPLAASLLPLSRESPVVLTPRESETLGLLAQGMTNRAIALQLGISLHTVKFHVTAIMGKLGAQSRTEAVVRATQLGLIAL